jgi:CheY-like chemotaxis protein
MPILSGVDTIKRLHSIGFAALPIVLMTAATPEIPRLRQELRQFGVTDILDKPFDIEQLLTIVECYWHQRQPEWRAAA